MSSRDTIGRARARCSRRRVPGIRRDLDHINAFWAQYEGTVSRVSESVNDRYLKAQGMTAGVATYAASRNLIVRFARQHGGRAWPSR